MAALWTGSAARAATSAAYPPSPPKCDQGDHSSTGANCYADYPGIASLSASPTGSTLSDDYPSCLGPAYAGSTQSAYCTQLTLTLTTSLPSCGDLAQGDTKDCYSEIDWGHTNGSVEASSGTPQGVYFLSFPHAAADGGGWCPGGLTPCDRFFFYTSSRTTTYPSAWVGVSNPIVVVRHTDPGTGNASYLDYIPQAGFYVVGNQKLSPTASFSYAPDSNDRNSGTPTDPTANPSSFVFTSHSTDPSGSLTTSWDLGDGTSASGPTVSHHYAKPGSYVVKITVTNPDNLTSTLSQTVVVKAPPLTLGLGFPEHDDGQIPVGSTFDVNVSAVTGPGAGALSDLAFQGGTFTESNGSTLSYTTAATSPFELEPNSGYTSTLHVKAVAPGTVTLTSVLIGTDAAGESTSGTSSRTLTVLPAAATPTGTGTPTGAGTVTGAGTPTGAGSASTPSTPSTPMGFGHASGVVAKAATMTDASTLSLTLSNANSFPVTATYQLTQTGHGAGARLQVEMDRAGKTSPSIALSPAVKITLAPHTRAKVVKLHLSAAGRKLLSAGRSVRATLVTVLRSPTGQVRRATASVTLRVVRSRAGKAGAHHLEN